MSFARKGGRSECKGHSARRRGELIQSGVKVAIVGPPNAGKSSLLNVLAAREAAIVSPIPGTTRDAVEVSIELEGFKVRMATSSCCLFPLIPRHKTVPKSKKIMLYLFQTVPIKRL